MELSVKGHWRRVDGFEVSDGRVGHLCGGDGLGDVAAHPRHIRIDLSQVGFP